jgi:hypothetical protein
MFFLLISPSSGGNFPSQAKTECAFKMLTQMQKSNIAIDGLGIQSHYSANPGAFPSKESAHFTMDRLKVSTTPHSSRRMPNYSSEHGSNGCDHGDGRMVAG